MVMVIYPSFWRFCHNSRYPPILTTFLYTYALTNMIYLGEPSDNFNLKLPRLIYMHIHAKILLYLSKEKSNCHFPTNVTVFLPALTVFQTTTSQILYKFHSLVNNEKEYIRRKIIKKFILFRLFVMMIEFRGLMKITGNVYGVIKYSKE